MSCEDVPELSRDAVPGDRVADGLRDDESHPDVRGQLSGVTSAAVSCGVALRLVSCTVVSCTVVSRTVVSRSVVSGGVEAQMRDDASAGGTSPTPNR